jgi:hypothetical protein
MGRTDEAMDHGLLSILRRVRPDGSIQILPKHTKETGTAIATLVRQCELADDDERLAELWPTIRRAVDFVADRHAEAAEMGPDYPGHRLLPPAFLDGGISGPFPDYPNALQTLWGLKQAAEAGERLDLPAHDRVRALYEDLRSGFHASAERDVRETEEGIPYLPMNMVEREYDRPQSVSGALAFATYPGEVFDADSRFVRNFLELLDAIDDEEGIPVNMGWMHDQGIYTYVAVRCAHVWLRAGHPEKAVDYLYAFANHAAPSRVWREEQALRESHSAEFTGDMPHNWASVEFIRLVRNLLVFEVDGGLDLLAGLPDEWLPEEGDPLVLESTPTRYGPIDLRLAAAGDEHGEGAGGGDDGREDGGGDDGGGYVLTVRRAPGNQSPGRTVLHWDGMVRSAVVDGVETALDRTDDGGWQLPPEVTAARIRLVR